MHRGRGRADSFRLQIWYVDVYVYICMTMTYMVFFGVYVYSSRNVVEKTYCLFTSYVVFCFYLILKNPAENPFCKHTLDAKTRKFQVLKFS